MRHPRNRKKADPVNIVILFVLTIIIGAAWFHGHFTGSFGKICPTCKGTGYLR